MDEYFFMTPREQIQTQPFMKYLYRSILIFTAHRYVKCSQRCHAEMHVCLVLTSQYLFSLFAQLLLFTENNIRQLKT